MTEELCVSEPALHVEVPGCDIPSLTLTCCHKPTSEFRRIQTAGISRHKSMFKNKQPYTLKSVYLLKSESTDFGLTEEFSSVHVLQPF